MRPFVAGTDRTLGEACRVRAVSTDDASVISLCHPECSNPWLRLPIVPAAILLPPSCSAGTMPHSPCNTMRGRIARHLVTTVTSARVLHASTPTSCCIDNGLSSLHSVSLVLTRTAPTLLRTLSGALAARRRGCSRPQPVAAAAAGHWHCRRPTAMLQLPCPAPPATPWPAPRRPHHRLQ